MKKPFNAYCGSEPYTFVCYGHADAEAVYPELSWLNGNGFHIWYDEGIEAGLSWRDEVASAIMHSSLFLIFISPSSVLSPVCLQELNLALTYERKILAVHIDETLLPPGMELSLNDKQAIIKNHYSESEFRNKLLKALNKYVYDRYSDEETQPGPALDGDSSIAILPFSYRGGSRDGEYLSEGIADELIHGMSQFNKLRVVSGFAFRNQDLDIRNIGRRFKVQSVLDGSVRQAGERIRINVRLTDTSDGSMIWSNRYDQEIKDIFDIQDNVASSVLQALKVSLRVSGEPSLEIGTQNIDAYDAYLLGTHEQRKDQQNSYRQAIQYFTRAKEIDPGFGRAFYQLGICYWEMTVYLGLDSKIIENAERAFEKAKKLQYVPEVPWVHVHRRLHPEIRPTQRELAVEALDLIRNRDTSWRNFEFVQIGRCLGSAGFYQASFDYLSKYTADSNEVSSKMDSVENDTQSLLPVLHRFAEAIESLTRRLESRPDDMLARHSRAMLFSRTKQFGKAEEDIQLLSDKPHFEFVSFYQRYWQNRLEDAQRHFERILQDDNLPLRFRFWSCSMMGQIEQAIGYMESSAERGAPIFNIRVMLNNAVPKNRIAEVEANPRFHRFLGNFDIDADWCSELSGLVNDVTGITGIHVDSH
jgi:TolB-like protein